jgi:hypothetical protein
LFLQLLRALVRIERKCDQKWFEMFRDHRKERPFPPFVLASFETSPEYSEKNYHSSFEMLRDYRKKRPFPPFDPVISHYFQGITSRSRHYILKMFSVVHGGLK